MLEPQELAKRTFGRAGGSRSGVQGGEIPLRGHADVVQEIHVGICMVIRCAAKRVDPVDGCLGKKTFMMCEKWAFVNTGPLRGVIGTDELELIVMVAADAQGYVSEYFCRKQGTSMLI